MNVTVKIGGVSPTQTPEQQKALYALQEWFRKGCKRYGADPPVITVELATSAK